MPECTNQDVGKLLHGYEIGILSDENRTKFEQHLLECEHCYEELARLEREAELLVSGSLVKRAVNEVLSESTEAGSVVRRVWSHLWPKKPFVFRPALAYLLVLLLIIPAYHGFRSKEEPRFQEVRQTIRLSTARMDLAPIFRKSMTDAALLTFHYEGAKPGDAYRVTIESEDGTIAYNNSEFNTLDRNEIGRLHLDLPGLKSGVYRLTVSDPAHDSALPSQEYYFRVEE
jgi:hypothetical protein